MSARRERFARALAAAGALLGGAALALQLVLLAGVLNSPGLAVWRFLGYFTLLSNVLAFAVLLRGAWVGQSAPRLELATATAIAMVGLVYTLLLRATWNPQGWQKIADSLLHDVTPLLFVAWFLLRPRGALGGADVLRALIFPLAYVVYALARGAADGWYAYWFLDPSRQTPAQMAISVLGLAVAFAVVAAALAFASNRVNVNALSRARDVG